MSFKSLGRGGKKKSLFPEAYWQWDRFCSVRTQRQNLSLFSLLHSVVLCRNIPYTPQDGDGETGTTEKQGGGRRAVSRVTLLLPLASQGLGSWGRGGAQVGTWCLVRRQGWSHHAFPRLGGAHICCTWVRNRVRRKLVHLCEQRERCCVG